MDLVEETAGYLDGAGRSGLEAAGRNAARCLRRREHAADHAPDAGGLVASWCSARCAKATCRGRGLRGTFRMAGEDVCRAGAMPPTACRSALQILLEPLERLL